MTVGGAQVVLGGDIITEIDGKTVESMDDVISAVNDARSRATRSRSSSLRGQQARTVDGHARRAAGPDRPLEQQSAAAQSGIP